MFRCCLDDLDVLNFITMKYIIRGVSLHFYLTIFVIIYFINNSRLLTIH